MAAPDVAQRLPGGVAVKKDTTDLSKVPTADEMVEAMKLPEPKAGERRSSSYAERVERWWNSRLHGTARRPDPEGEKRVECVVKDRATGRTVTKAEGKRTKKRSARGAARAAAVSKVCSSVKAAKGGRRVFVNLADLEFTYRVLEV